MVLADTPEDTSEAAVPLEVLGRVHAGAAKAYEGRGFADAIGKASPGCSLRAYAPVGKNPFWEAKLPDGKRHGPPGKRPRASRRRDWGPHLRSREKARQECVAWL